MSNLTNQEVIKILNVWGPEAIEKGLITEQEVYRALGSSSDKGAYKYNKAGGGMMNIDEMTRPLGYKEGKEVGVRERIYNWLAPNEKMSDEELRLQGINPDSVLPEERPQAEGRPEGVLQGIFSELFGGRGAEGSTLMDDATDIKTLGMIVELQGVLSFDEIDKMKNMSPIEIEILYNKTFGEEE